MMSVKGHQPTAFCHRAHNGNLAPMWEGKMKLPRRRFLHLAAGAAALPALSRIALAQAYPTRPVRLIVPIAPPALKTFSRA